MKQSRMKKTVLCLATVLCIAVNLFPFAVHAAGPVITAGDTWRNTRTEAQAEFTSDTTGLYYYLVTPIQVEIPEIDTSGDGTPCAAGEKVTVTVSELTTDSCFLWVVVKASDGTVGDISLIQIPEWDWWTLDEAGLLTIESNKGVTNWNTWLNSMDAFDKIWYQQYVTGVSIWKDVTNVDDDFSGEEYSHLAAYSVEDGNETCTVIDGVLYNKDVTTIYAYPQAKAGTEFDIPSTVDYIGHQAFAGNKNLESVTAGEVRIAQSAFWGAKKLKSFSADAIKNVVAPYAFYNSTNLESISVESDEKFSVDFCAFERCSSLRTFPFDKLESIGHSVFRNCSSLTEIQVPNFISYSAFEGCSSIETIVIPSTVTYLGANAFSGCTNLSSVTFESETPPVIELSAFNPVVSNFRFHVPEGSEDAYIAVLGDDFAEYILDEGVEIYPLFVNGIRVRNDRLTIPCGSGAAVFDAETSTLTLTNAEISQAGGKYGYKGAINSGLPNLNIILVGDNKITAEADSINTGINCNLTISGEGSLDCRGQIDIGRDNTLAYTGGEENGNLIIDGAEVNIGSYIFAQRNITFQGGTAVSIAGTITSNFNGFIKVTGEETAVTAKALSIGNNIYSEQTSIQFIMESGTLTLTGGVSFLSPDDGDTGKYAIRFYDKEVAEILLKGGNLQAAPVSGKVTNILSENIIVDETVEISAGAWDSDLIYTNTPLFVAAQNVVPTDENIAFTEKWKAAESSCIVFAVLYDQDGKVVAIQKVAAAGTNGEQEAVISASGWSTTDTGTLKLFLWRENNMQPVCQNYTAQIDVLTEESGGGK